MVSEGPSRPGRCWYCGQKTLRSSDPAEHLIPAAIGGALTTNSVCQSCNSAAGVRIDQPFLQDFFVRNARALYDIRDVRGRGSKASRHPLGRAQLEDGTPVRVDMTDKPWRPVVVPQVHESADTVTVSAATLEEAQELVARKLRRMKRDGQTVEQVGEPQTRSIEEIFFEVKIDALIRVRMAAKVALGALSLVLPDDWLDTRDARGLQGHLWDDTPTNADGVPLTGVGPVHVEGPFSLICRPPDHLVAFTWHGEGKANLLTSLFGQELLLTQVDLGGLPEPNEAWHLDPRSRIVTQTTFDEFALSTLQAGPVGSP